MNNKTNISIKATVAVFMVFAMSMTLGSITPIMAQLFAAFSDVPTATVTYISTIASLVSIPGSLLTGVIAGKKLGMKKTITLLVVIFVIAGCFPALVPSFTATLISRGVFGFAMGGLSVLGNPIVTALYSAEKRARILGVANFVSFGGAMVLQFFASFLSTFHWKFAFFTHALAIIPLIIILICLPEVKIEAENPKEKTSGYKVPVRAWYIIIAFSFAAMLMTPLFMTCSVFAANISDNVMWAATASMVYSVGTLLGGLIFGTWYRIFKKYSMPASCLCAAVGLFIVVNAGVIPVLLIGMIVAGIGYCSMMSFAMMAVGMITPVDSVPFATSILMALMNVFTFLASPLIGVISNMTGDAFYAPVYAAVIGYVAVAVVTAIAKPLPATKKSEA